MSNNYSDAKRTGSTGNGNGTTFTSGLFGQFSFPLKNQTAVSRLSTGLRSKFRYSPLGGLVDSTISVRRRFVANTVAPTLDLNTAVFGFNFPGKVPRRSPLPHRRRKQLRLNAGPLTPPLIERIVRRRYRSIRERRGRMEHETIAA